MENIQSQNTVLLTHGIVNQLSSLGSVCFDIYWKLWYAVLCVLQNN